MRDLGQTKNYGGLANDLALWTEYWRTFLRSAKDYRGC